MKGLGVRIKSARKAKGLSQTELAIRLNKTLRTVQKYESEEIEPSISCLEEIAEVLDISFAHLLGIPQHEDLSHIMMFDVEHKYGSHRVDEVVLFNASQLSQEEATDLVASGTYNDNVLVIPKRKWLSLFKNETTAE